MTEAAQRAPASVILRSAPDGPSPAISVLRTPSALWHHFEEHKPLVKAGGFLCQYDSEGISELVPTYGGPARYATGFVAR